MVIGIDSLGGRLMADGRGVVAGQRPTPREASRRAPPEPAAAAAPENGAQTFRYCAFLSYAHRDAATAKWLHESLEKYRVPAPLVGRRTGNGPVPARLYPIFRDRHELAASADLGRDIRDALASSRFLIVLCSPAAAQSRWTSAEIDSFKRMRPDGCVLAAIVEGEPFASDVPGREGEECFPPALRHAYDKRGRPTKKRAEPIAADLRESGDGKRLGLLKIVAGMLGVGLDEIVQRETARRQKRLHLIAAASVIGMAVTSTLAVVAVEARDAARDQRREAEGLVGFMLGDLRQKLEPIGRLDALDAVGARALGYFEAQDKSDLSEAGLAQRAKALTLLGEISSSRGDLDGALRRYREAMAGTAETLRREPDEPQRIFDHAQNVFWVGDIALQRGQTEIAERQMRDYRSLADRLVAIDPAKPEWQMERIYADANLGIVQFRTGRFADAAATFQASLAAIERLVAGAPRNSAYRKSLIETLAWLADAREQEGRLGEALKQRVRQLGLLEALLARARSDADNKRQALVTHRAIARLSATRGNVAGALAHGRHAVAMGEELMRTEPDNADWAGLVAGPYLDLSETLIVAGRAAEAAVPARAGCRIADRLVARDATVKSWRVDLRGLCLNMRARLALARGAGGEAQALARQGVALARTEHEGAASPETRLALATALVFEGVMTAAADQRAAARAAFAKAHAAWPAAMRLPPRATARHVILLAGLGRPGAAAPLAASLDRIGFRHPTYLNDRIVAQRQ